MYLIFTPILLFFSILTLVNLQKYLMLSRIHVIGHHFLYFSIFYYNASQNPLFLAVAPFQENLELPDKIR